MSGEARHDEVDSASEQPSFGTTHWSLVAAAASADSHARRAALESLCRVYWYPIYAFIRRLGNPPDEAADLTQSFFLELLSKDRLARVDAERGRFRAFVRTAVRHFVANQRRGELAQKRGGGRTVVSFEISTGESRYQCEPVDEVTPEHLFERRWALTITNAALANLESRYAADGRAELFQQLAPFLSGSGPCGYAELAERLGMTEAAVKTAIHRLRVRCRELIRAEVGQTVESPDAIDDELRHLFQVLAE